MTGAAQQLAGMLLLLAAAARAEEPAKGRERFVELGPTRAQRDSSAPVLEFPFSARADEELAAARVRLTFAPASAGAPPLQGLEVLVNDEQVALFSAADLQPGGAVRELPVRRELLSDRNQLTVRLRDREGRCVAQAGTWKSVRSIGVVLKATPVPLPNELALLPIPFFDRGYDAEATIPIVLARPPSPAGVRLAGLVAGWLAVDAPIPLSFAASVGALPDSRAVVLVAGNDDAAALGLAPVDGPLVRLVDHPLHPESNAKLLVIGGRDEAELRTAVESLASRTSKLAGPEVRLSPAPPLPPALAYSASRWVPLGRNVPFADYPGDKVLSHDGSTPATLSVRFRVAPDLWVWPSELVVLDLGWTTRLPPGATAPRLDVEMNGYFLATLPQPRTAGETAQRVRLRIPREHMRGFNQLLVHVHYPEPDPCGAAALSAGRGEPPRVAIAGDSLLHLEGASHFASLPDVSRFAFDGYPFTRVPDLGETALVLPEAPAAAELSMALSIVAQLAQVTGRVGTRATFLSAARATDEELAGKDLLVIGGAADNPLVARWSRLLPLRLDPAGAQVQRPTRAAALLDLLGGIGPLIDERRAGAVLSEARADVAALEGIESPLSPGRSAIIATGTQPSQLVPFSEFLGYAESRTGGGDLLLVSGGHRAMFQIGSSFGSGRLDAWTRLRWFLANHWMALLPVLLLGVLMLAAELRRFLSRRMRERLALGEAA